VHEQLLTVRSRISDLLSELEAKGNDPFFTEAVRTNFVVAAAAWFFVEYLRVHPYANGNGHLARFIISALMGNYGRWPVRWTVDPRPGGNYDQLISAYRDGDPAPLERALFDAIE
jgi:fido (protein-threonine AMPylation protein)